MSQKSNVIKIAFLDLETTGLPKTVSFNRYHPYEETKHYNNSRIVQIAVIVCEIDEKMLSEFVENKENKICSSDILTNIRATYPFIKINTTHNYIIKPDGFVIKNANIHNITQSMACSIGLPFKDAIELIEPDLEECKILVAHNIIFDKNILLSELHRYGIRSVINKIKYMKEICTSKCSNNITKIPYNSSQFKQPKLSELYYFLFNKHAEGLHNALTDVSVTLLCFAELFAKKYWSINLLN
jgi:DNA polymerase III epsilon subunit-like protein